MWFCCQLWQCGFQTCFAPIDIWKTWGGWSHVVHPTKGNSTSEIFLDRSTRFRVGDDELKQKAVYLEHQHQHQHQTPGYVERRIQEVDVEVHSLPSPAGVVMDWDPDEGEPYRTPSTEWTKLEQRLDYWREEHARFQSQDTEDEEEPHIKVRYNDTGSLEEVNMDSYADYYLDDNDSIGIEDEEALSTLTDPERDSLRHQYQRLWQLRASLEEDEDLTDPGWRPKPKHKSKEPKLSNHLEEHELQYMDALGTLLTLSRTNSSLEQSPVDPEPGTSRANSYETNAEPFIEEGSVRWNLLQLPSYEARRQTYRNILSWRLRRMEAKGSKPPSVEETSFDSADTEESSTDASRLDQTTSFESTGTTDNTDSTGGTSGTGGLIGDGQLHRLQQLRADSGYKSMETPAPTQLPKISSSHQNLLSPGESSSHPRSFMNLGDSSEVELATVIESHCRPSLGDSAETEYPPLPTAKCGHRSHHSGYPDESVSGVNSPTGLESHVCDGRRSSCSRSASKKRKEFGRTSGDLESSTGRHRCHSMQYYPSYACTRDYSVDEKSDALFREFSRCEPWSMDLPRQRFGSGSRRRLPHNPRHSHYPYPELPPKAPPSRNSIDEENDAILYADEEAALHSVPIIRVADEDSIGPL